MDDMKIIEKLRTRYNDVDVWQTNDGYDFEVAGGTHATWHHSRVLTGYAWDAITAAALLRENGPPARLLMLGLGGGTAVRQLRHFCPKMKITAVEIDPEMITLARRYMQLDTLDIQIECTDGYAYAHETPPRFDAVIDDIYLGQTDGVTRPQAYNRDLIDNLCHCLNPGGILATNMITGQEHRRIHTEARNAFIEAFGAVTCIHPWKGYNETLLSGRWTDKQNLQKHTSRLSAPSDILAWQNLRITHS